MQSPVLLHCTLLVAAPEVATPVLGVHPTVSNLAYLQIEGRFDGTCWEAWKYTSQTTTSSLIAFSSAG